MLESMIDMFGNLSVTKRKNFLLCLLFYNSNLESLQLKAAVDSWNAIVADVRNKIAFLRVSPEVYLEKIGLML